MNKNVITTVALAGMVSLSGIIGVSAAPISKTVSAADVAVATTQSVSTDSQTEAQTAEGTEVEGSTEAVAEDAEAPIDASKATISEEAAKKIALDSAGAIASFLKIELEDVNGIIVYGIEVKTDTTQLDVKVDANTGAILKSDADNENDQEEASSEKTGAADNDQVEHENQNEDPAGYED